MKRWPVLAFLLALIAFLFSPCRRHSAVKGLQLSVAFSARALTDNLFTDVTFRFKTSAAFDKLDEPLQVFAELRGQERLVVADSFVPTVPTTGWLPGKEYTFARRIYIPSFIDEFSPSFRGYETVVLTAGLRSESQETTATRIDLITRRLRIAPAPAFPAIVYMNGWFEPETGPGTPPENWRWTSREATCAIDNPGRGGLLVIRGSVEKEAISGQKIIIKIEDSVLDEFVPEGRDFEKSYPVRAQWLGTRKDFSLSISVDKTFVPAKVIPGSKDRRELGVRISLLYFR